MSQPILLKDQTPTVDPDKIGISYSGGGPLVLVELGIARAFVQKAIIPHVITGASAGALAGTAHALDVRQGKGIDMAAELLSQVSNSLLGLTAFHVVGRLIVEREHLTSLGDNAAIGPLIKNGLVQSLGLHDVRISTFVAPRYPKLMVVATDVINGGSVWFSDDTPIDDALIASSAIPGLFPWRTMAVDGRELTLADGGMVTNQPLSNLVDQGCGTVYACAVGPTGALPPPTNALDNAFRSVTLMMHQATKLEEDYVRLKMGDRGVVHHIHPEVAFPVHEFDFTPTLVHEVIEDACARTLAWLSEPHPD